MPEEKAVSTEPAVKEVKKRKKKGSKKEEPLPRKEKNLNFKSDKLIAITLTADDLYRIVSGVFSLADYLVRCPLQSLTNRGKEIFILAQRLDEMAKVVEPAFRNREDGQRFTLEIRRSQWVTEDFWVKDEKVSLAGK